MVDMGVELVSRDIMWCKLATDLHAACILLKWNILRKKISKNKFQLEIYGHELLVYVISYLYRLGIYKVILWRRYKLDLILVLKQVKVSAPSWGISLTYTKGASL